MNYSPSGGFFEPVAILRSAAIPQLRDRFLATSEIESRVPKRGHVRALQNARRLNERGAQVDRSV
jgi:hypothetical protein